MVHLNLLQFVVHRDIAEQQVALGLTHEDAAAATGCDLAGLVVANWIQVLRSVIAAALQFEVVESEMCGRSMPSL
jgi:hypothetical protein